MYNENIKNRIFNKLDAALKIYEKMIFETRKILHNKDLRVTATTVRVPVYNCHSESINIEFEKQFDMPELVSTLENFENLVVMDNPSKNIYPMPVVCDNRDEVF